jgi:hypothetical protein
MASAATAEDNAAARAERIREVVNAAGAEWRRRHPWLQRQDSIGAGILIFALAGMLGSGYGFVSGVLPAWATILLTAFFASLTHELEHDLIHWMYFRSRPWAHHLMLALCWLARPSTINPWIRRGLHFNHHKHSGMENDREERGITNGEPWNLARLLMLGDAGFSAWWRIQRLPERAQRRTAWLRVAAIYFPLGWLHWGLWYLFLLCHGVLAIAALAGQPIALSASTAGWLQGLDTLVVVWIAPNILRSFCLHFVSSNMHYYGDIQPGNVVQQTQVLTVWWTWPFQLFCFNFGGTHAIHHFVVKDPFYLRQMTARKAHAVMREMGVRFNDVASLARANRWHADGRDEAKA